MDTILVLNVFFKKIPSYQDEGFTIIIRNKLLMAIMNYSQIVNVTHILIYIKGIKKNPMN